MSLWLWGFWAKGAINAAHLSLATRVKKRKGRWMAVETLTDADAAALPAGSSFCVEAALSLTRALGFSLPPIPPPSRPLLRLLPSFPVLAPRALLLLSLLLPQLLPACLLHSLSTPLPSLPLLLAQLALDYEIFSSFAAALLSCVTKKKRFMDSCGVHVCQGDSSGYWLCCGAAAACDVCNYAFVCESWMCTLHMCMMAVFKRNVMMGHFQACDCLDW